MITINLQVEKIIFFQIRCIVVVIGAGELWTFPGVVPGDLLQTSMCFSLQLSRARGMGGVLNHLSLLLEFT